MTDYPAVLTALYPGAEWTLNGDAYDGLVWLSEGDAPSQAELDAAWPQVEYDRAYAQVEQERHAAYISDADPRFSSGSVGRGRSRHGWMRCRP